MTHRHILTLKFGIKGNARQILGGKAVQIVHPVCKSVVAGCFITNRYKVDHDNILISKFIYESDHL